METDPTRMCELLVGLPDVNVVGVGDWPLFLRIAISTRALRPSCPSCGGVVWRHGVDEVELVDLPCFGRQTRLVWLKQRWRCPNMLCAVVTFVESDDRIAADRAAITDRAGTVGDVPSRPPRPLGDRGRCRSRLRLAHRHGRRRPLRHRADRRPEPHRRRHRGRARRGAVLPVGAVQASGLVDAGRRRRPRPTVRRCAWS